MAGRSAGAAGYNAAGTMVPREVAMAEMREFAGIYYREGALDPKTLQLVALAAMAAAGCTS
jgi:alkylhydroperoxidase/carboxymuconolactone decarboxylase family protein YurZ